jgi:hypothetical protein
MLKQKDFLEPAMAASERQPLRRLPGVDQEIAIIEAGLAIDT